jgi:hypothetical protein
MLQNSLVNDPVTSLLPRSPSLKWGIKTVDKIIIYKIWMLNVTFAHEIYIENNFSAL